MHDQHSLSRHSTQASPLPTHTSHAMQTQLPPLTPGAGPAEIEPTTATPGSSTRGLGTSQLPDDGVFTIGVAGGTGSGKTTLCKALQKEVVGSADGHTRVLIVHEYVCTFPGPFVYFESRLQPPAIRNETTQFRTASSPLSLPPPTHCPFHSPHASRLDCETPPYLEPHSPLANWTSILDSSPFGLHHLPFSVGAVRICVLCVFECGCACVCAWV
jgi:hypothetical protein